MTEPDTSTESSVSPAPAQIDTAKDTAETYRPIEKAPPPKSPLFFIVFIIALVIIGYTGYTMYQNSQARPNLKSAPTTLPTVTVSTTSADITDLTAPEIAQNETSWPAFENSVYTFTYPPQATIEPLNPGEGNGTYVFIKGPTQKPETEFFDGLSVRFRLVTDIGNNDLQDYVQAQVGQINEAGMAKVTKGPTYTSVNGNSGYVYTEEGLGTFQVYYVQSFDGSQTVEITNSTVDPTNQGYEDMAEQILGTFDFVN